MVWVQAESAGWGGSKEPRVREWIRNGFNAHSSNGRIYVEVPDSLEDVAGSYLRSASGDVGNDEKIEEIATDLRRTLMHYVQRRV